jgi:hypothetical protein
MKKIKKITVCIDQHIRTEIFPKLPTSRRHSGLAEPSLRMAVYQRSYVASPSATAFLVPLKRLGRNVWADIPRLTQPCLAVVATVTQQRYRVLRK